jgi:hypothetical protein
MIGGLSAIRREMLNIMREEHEEQWQNLEYKGTQVCVSMSSLPRHLFCENSDKTVN